VITGTEDDARRRPMEKTEQRDARFKMDNCRITRVKELPRVCYLTVMVQSGRCPDFHDLVLFQPPSFPLVEGGVVTVSGEIQKKKPRDGGTKWEIELIARKVEVGDDSKAPRPRASRDDYANRKPPAEVSNPDDDVDF
jgi:hypothetical protein